MKLVSKWEIPKLPPTRIKNIPVGLIWYASTLMGGNSSQRIPDIEDFVVTSKSLAVRGTHTNLYTSKRI